MTETVEIEFKNLLTYEEFQRLLNKFQITADQFYKQTNYYFDTNDFHLKSSGSALRIREKQQQFELTLKQPTGNSIGLLETNQTIDRATASQFIENNTIPSGPISNKLATIPLTTTLHCFGILVTKRAEISYQGGTLVFDISSYANITDYEIEYEVSDFAKGKVQFETLLANENIVIKSTPNKIQRLENAIMNEESN